MCINPQSEISTILSLHIELDVIVNPQLNTEQKNQVKDLLVEYKEIFSDVPKVTHLIEHKVQLTESEPMMTPDDIFSKLSGSQFYSTFDFCKGYWAIPMAEVQGFHYFCHVEGTDEIQGYAIWNGKFRIDL